MQKFSKEYQEIPTFLLYTRITITRHYKQGNKLLITFIYMFDCVTALKQIVLYTQTSPASSSIDKNHINTLHKHLMEQNCPSGRRKE